MAFQKKGLFTGSLTQVAAGGAPGTVERVTGEILGFTFKSDSGAFAVSRLMLPDESVVSAVGALAHLQAGQQVALTGTWEHNARFGRQFKVESLLIEEPRTRLGLERYLSTSIDGIGPELAHRIVEAFGLETLQVLRDTPERLLEVPGISRKKLEKISLKREELETAQNLEVTLRAFGLTSGQVRKVAERFGKDAPSVVARDPYRLTELRGIGFRTADTIARANGVDLEDPSRVAAAIVYVVEQAEEEGSCYLPEGVAVERMQKLEIPLEAARFGIDRMVGEGRIVRHPDPEEHMRPLFRPAMERTEEAVASALRARASTEGATWIDLELVEKRIGITLNEQQRKAVRTALSHRLCVITGGPGTGKTTIVKVLLAAASLKMERWLLAAPTGRAAKRLTESCGQPARTIHRLLEWTPQELGFTRDPTNPLETDGLLVDEASMLDLPLLEAVLDALPDKARLVLVGDVDQLPSVGPGQVLRDIIRSGTLPVARLTEIYRQAADSGIVRNAHRINRGETPRSAEKEEGVTRDFFVLAKDDPSEAQRLITQVITERLPKLGFDPRQDVQVLTPMHNGPLGTSLLNQQLQAALNPDGAPMKWRSRTFRVGDRVIQTRNDYDNEVFNGDVGRILSATETSLTIDFDGRTVTLVSESLDALELAYAISIHKSQGSEYPAVIVVVHHAHFVMLRRNLLYTAVTRARRFTCLITSERGLRVAVSRDGGEERYTLLTERLQEERLDRL